MAILIKTDRGDYMITQFYRVKKHARVEGYEYWFSDSRDFEVWLKPLTATKMVLAIVDGDETDKYRI
jgi:hypothetical protein